MDTEIKPKYRIDAGVEGWYRVVNTRTCDESALYSYSQCQDIIAMAERGELRGSFNCNSL